MGREIIDKNSLVVGRSASGQVLTFHAQRKEHVLLEGDSNPCFEYDVFPNLVAYIRKQNAIAERSMGHAKSRAGDTRPH